MTMSHTPSRAISRARPPRWISARRRICTGNDKEHEMSGRAITIEGTSVLVTGANRGIGRALVDEALRRGAKQVYAGTRRPMTHPDERVTPLRLDVTDPGQIEEAVEKVASLDLLINNAGIALYDDLSDPTAVERQMAVNFYGPYAVTRAFLPLVAGSRGAVVNNVSLMAVAPFPVTPGYAISKAALLNLTQSLRALMAQQGVSVHAVLTGPTDTDMTRGFEVPKASPQAVARAIFDGLARGEEDIFPDPMSESMAENWRASAVKAFEHRFAAFVAPEAKAV
jgi:NAD(P)-dependent dehydrogenase (short-subunit alcohol dehydrogenase family)